MPHIWLCHVYVRHFFHTWMCHVKHMRVSWLPHMNESCHTYEWAITHVGMSHATHMIESCLCGTHCSYVDVSCQTYASVMTPTYEWVGSHIIYVNEPCHTYAWVGTYDTYEYGVSRHIWISHVYICKKHLSHMSMSHGTYVSARMSHESCLHQRQTYL